MKEKINSYLVTDIADIHTHIIPMMDDGCKNEEESLLLLSDAKNENIRRIVLTPHFYPEKEKPIDFINRRNEKYKSIKDMVNNIGIEACLGAEVYYFTGISNSSFAKDLVINNTNYLLLEMPFDKWTSDVTSDVIKLIKYKNIIPIIAHFERYIGYGNLDDIYRLKSSGCLIQSNSEFFIQDKRKALKFLKNGLIDFIASDCHNNKNRKETLGDAINIINKKDPNMLKILESNSNKLFN